MLSWQTDSWSLPVHFACVVLISIIISIFRCCFCFCVDFNLLQQHQQQLQNRSNKSNTPNKQTNNQTQTSYRNYIFLETSIGHHSLVLIVLFAFKQKKHIIMIIIIISVFIICRYFYASNAILMDIFDFCRLFCCCCSLLSFFSFVFAVGSRLVRSVRSSSCSVVVFSTSTKTNDIMFHSNKRRMVSLCNVFSLCFFINKLENIQNIQPIALNPVLF